MLGIFVEYPWAAALVGGGFLLLYGHSSRRAPLFAAIIWMLYALYEYAMKRRILCTGECNIRVDLLLLYPFLLVASLIALVSYARFLGKRDPSPDRVP